MERIQVLIDKLAEQSKRGESPAQLLITVQLLQQELMNAQQTGSRAGSAKVAVVMPSRPAYQEPQPVFEAPRNNQPQPAYKEPEPEHHVPEPIYFEKEVTTPTIIEPVVEEVKQAELERELYVLRKLSIEEPARKEEPKKETHHPQTFIPFDAEEETPTLLRHNNEREVHELIGEQKESLNDRLKQEKTELGHVLKDTPIKDLRKGIGINDKFLFVNELFRGDEAMYERSIKTINGFHILPEAEYWINRELKVKLGWNDNKDTVQHFYHLVRRRFS
jgi:hypothetical protein